MSRIFITACFLLLLSCFIGYNYDNNSSHTSYLPLFRETKNVIQSVSSPNVLLHIKEWPVNSPKGLIFITHGFGEHIQRYDNLAKFLNNNEYSVYGLDHQGHGLSGGDRVHVQDFMHYTTDVLEYINYIEDKLNNNTLPKFLIGHSMGGTIAIQTILEKPEIWKGVIVSAPALEDVPAPIQFLSETLAKYNPKLPLLGFSIDKNGLNSDPEKINTYLHDDLIYCGNMKVGWGSCITKAMQNAHTNAPHWPNIPILALHGTDDTITKLSDTETFFNNLPNNLDKTLKTYSGIRHELFQERNKQEIMEDILLWITNHN